MLYSPRRWASIGPGISGVGYIRVWTSGRGISTQAWWGTQQHRELPRRSWSPEDDRRRTKPWLISYTSLFCQGSFARLSVGQQTGRGEGVSSWMISTPIMWFQRSCGRSTWTCEFPLGKPVCAAFEEYKDVPKTAPLDFTEDDITWVASNLSSAAVAMGAEVIELRNWLIRFGCVS